MNVLNLCWLNVCFVVVALGIFGCGGGDNSPAGIGDSSIIASDTGAVGDNQRAEHLADVRESDFATNDLGSDTPLDSGAPGLDGSELDQGHGEDVLEVTAQVDVADLQDTSYLPDSSDTFDSTEVPCLPACEGKDCGDDGCGGVCGECEDDNPCTDDSCDVDGKCIHEANSAACEDNDPCTLDECSEGECKSEAKVCDDGDPCTVDSCDALTGECTGKTDDANGLPCVDGNPCTTTDICQDGECAGELLPIDQLANLACICVGNEDCLAVEDGNVCNGTLWCVVDVEGPDTCQVEPATILDCDDSLACTDDKCDALSGCVHTPENATCDDGNECTGALCDPDDGCLNPAVEDGQGCGVEEGWGTCQGGTCECTPKCNGKECGDNGCAGECGPCPGEQDACIENVCVCQPNCEGQGCGWDGCSALCIECTDGKMCKAATNTCECPYVACGDLCCDYYEPFCIEGKCAFYIEQPDVILTFENVTGTSLELWMENLVPVLGFQFQTSALTITAVTGGSTEAAGIDLMIGDFQNFILGFGFGQNTIPPGKEMLLKVEFELKEFPSGFCLGNPNFSDEQNQPAEVLTIPECYYYPKP